jgi:hypothetical protein
VELAVGGEAVRSGIAELRDFLALAPVPAPIVDLAYLAKQFGLAGGNVKNCAVAAALAAAAEGRPVEMRHLMQAIAREFEKIGKSVALSIFESLFEVI